jgi:hypothetical protein
MNNFIFQLESLKKYFLYHKVIPMMFGTMIIKAPLTPDFAGRPT